MSTPAKRKGRGRSKASVAMIEAAQRILAEIQPASVRAVCYRLFTEERIRDMSKASTDAVSKQLVYAREYDIVPWDWIVDETREAERVSSWSSPEEIIASAVSQYRKDYWADQPRRVEVWTEKGTVRGTLAPVLAKFGVTLRVMHGFGSATSIHTAAIESVSDDRPFTVLYAGDWDPSGMWMSEFDLPSRLERYGGKVRIDRFALTEQDLALPSFAAASKSKDPRFAWFRKEYGERCFELDALSPVFLRDRTSEAILDLLDLPRWNACVKVESAERESMQNILTDWRRSISRPADNYSGFGP